MTITYTDPQGSEAWLAARRGVITGSRAKDARDFKPLTVAEKKQGLTRGEPSGKQTTYALDTARERAGGAPPKVFVNHYMRVGIEQEGPAREAFEAKTGELVLEAGFITTDDGRFGCSVDGFYGDDGIVEIKTMVSSNTLFQAFVQGDISEYVDQCNMVMWVTGRKFVKLVLWAPDLKQPLRIIDIPRNDDVINELERDLLQFNARVDAFHKAIAKTQNLTKKGRRA